MNKPGRAARRMRFVDVTLRDQRRAKLSSATAACKQLAIGQH